MIAVTSAGKAKVKSASRITSSSTHPRRAAASRPSDTPKPMPMPTAISPTAIEFCEPTINCETMSRPRLSVPSQCAEDGLCSLDGTSISEAGCGVHTSDSSAVNDSSATSTPPITKLVCRSARSVKVKLIDGSPAAVGRSRHTARRQRS
jgi:hypothetical protein